MEDFLMELIAQVIGGLFEGLVEGVGATFLDAVAKVFDWCWRSVLWLGGAVLPGITLEDRLLRLGGNGIIAVVVYALFWR